MQWNCLWWGQWLSWQRTSCSCCHCQRHHKLTSKRARGSSWHMQCKYEFAAEYCFCRLGKLLKLFHTLASLYIQMCLYTQMFLPVASSAYFPGQVLTDCQVLHTVPARVPQAAQLHLAVPPLPPSALSSNLCVIQRSQCGCQPSRRLVVAACSRMIPS